MAPLTPAFLLRRDGRQWLIDVAAGDGWMLYRTGPDGVGLQVYVGGGQQWSVVAPLVNWPQTRTSMRRAFRRWLAAQEEERADGRDQLAVGTGADR